MSGENKNHVQTKDDLNDVEIDILISKDKKYKKLKKMIELSDVEKNQSVLISKAQKQIIISNYFRSRFWKEFLWVSLGALVITIAFDYFISSTGSTGIFPAGIGALARFAAVLVWPNSISMQGSMYFVFYFLLNIPLFVFGLFKIGWKLTFTTLIYILDSIAFDQVLKLIPYINPNEFHLIFNYQAVESISGSWNTSIWLFIFAAMGGLLLGTGYGMVYRVGSSTGGLDFATMYFSMKKDKSIGSLNRKVNFIILAIIISANTLVVKTDQISDSLQISALYNLSQDQLSSGVNIYGTDLELWQGVVLYAINHSYILGDIGPDGNLTNLTFNEDLIYAFEHGKPDLETREEVIKMLETLVWDKINQGKILPEDLKEIWDYISDNDCFDDVWHYSIVNAIRNGYDTYPTDVLLRIKFMFLFGPSLFSSIVLIFTSGAVTNVSYPKYKVKTLVIYTKNPDEVIRVLNENGLQNDIINWDATNNVSNNYLHRSIIMVSMSTLNWAPLESKLFLVDPELRVTELRTRNVKGFFKYDVKKPTDSERAKQELYENDMELEKIRQVALVRANKLKEKMNKKMSVLRKRKIYKRKNDRKEYEKKDDNI